MLLKSVIDSPCGIRFMADTLHLNSGYGRKRLLESAMMESAEEIRGAYGELKRIYLSFVRDASNAPLRRRLGARLMTLRDISGTIVRLTENGILDEVEFFEIKCLSLLAAEIDKILSGADCRAAELPDLEGLVSKLDPEGTRIPSFYIYDAYSPELREIRSLLRKLGGYTQTEFAVGSGCCDASAPETGKMPQTTAGEKPISGGPGALSGEKAPENPQEKDKTAYVQARRMELTERAGKIETQVRKWLSGEIRKYAPDLKNTLDILAKLDILLAKALQIEELGLCFPEISCNGRTAYKGMFHPHIKQTLAEKGKEYTPVDLDFGVEAVTVIGANMGGKTVALKTAALCQYLFQFGFGLPAQSACVDIKKDVVLCVGDRQDELGGLSSFAAEVTAIDGVIRRVRDGEYILALIDEPARTTNPVEGTALVAALLKVLEGKKLSLLLTTHYNVAGGHFRRLRVVGLVDGIMDYRLKEAGEGDVPQEAVRIARKLGADAQWIGEAEKMLNETI